MTELDLKELERQLEFAKISKNGFFYINKATVIELVGEIRRLQGASSGTLPTPAEYLSKINAKLDLLVRIMDENN